METLKIRGLCYNRKCQAQHGTPQRGSEGVKLGGLTLAPSYQEIERRGGPLRLCGEYPVHRSTMIFSDTGEQKRYQGGTDSSTQKGKIGKEERQPPAKTFSGITMKRKNKGGTRRIETTYWGRGTVVRSKQQQTHPPKG